MVEHHAVREGLHVAGRARAQTRARSVAFLGALMVWVHAAGADAVLYSTGFESAEGYVVERPLSGQRGWVGTFPDADGVVTNFFAGEGQQAYVGFLGPTNGDYAVSVRQPLNVDPERAGRPVVTFTVTMQIQDSTTALKDSFRWSVFSAEGAGEFLFALDFDNATQEITYLLQGSTNFISTDWFFVPGGVYDLRIRMDFRRNEWSAWLVDEPIVTAEPITTRGSRLTLGDVSAVWVLPGDSDTFGDNYMVFDNYRVDWVAPETLPFRLSTIGTLEGGGVALRLLGHPGATYGFESTSDFSHWLLRRTVVAVDGVAEFVDTAAPSAGGVFYRAQLVRP